MNELAEIKDLLQCQSKKIDKIVFAIYGDDDAKIKGMADTLNEHEKYIKNDNNQKMRLAGGLMVVSALWFLLLDSVKQFWQKVF